MKSKIIIAPPQGCFIDKNSIFIANITLIWRLYGEDRTIHFRLYIYIYIYISCLKVIEGDSKASFSIATTPRCKSEWCSFPLIAQISLDPYLIMLGVQEGGIKYHLWVFGMTRPGIEPRSPEPLANTHYANGLYIYIYKVKSATVV